ncbi:MAG: response regulator [Cohnella sp.]|nr:response regulator [Cohnella sp.]
MHHEHVQGTYDSILVLFSYVVAVVASYNVLDLAGKISISASRSRWLWLLFGAAVMGLGIWSMHFIGMLAFSLPFPVAYNLGYVILSVIAAIVASFIALYFVGRPKLAMRELLAGGALLALGISAMHYIGMAAMQIGITYDPLLFALSIVIALVASLAALWLSVFFRNGDKRGIHWMKFGSGLIMGLAVVGMHYTGMAAARFASSPAADSSGIVLDHKWLAYFISGGTLFTLGLSLLGIFISNRLSHKDSEIQEKSAEIYSMNQELRQLNEHLEQSVRERTAQLESARDEAIKANQTKSQFLANMSHELRTPLNAIIGYSEMLMEEAEESGQTVFAKDLDKIRKSGKHLLSLINDILDISKIEAGKMEVYIEECDLGSLVQEVTTTIKPLVDANDNRLEVRLVEGSLTADVTKLRQILLNLLSNASKFTNGGKVSLEIERQTRDEQDGYEFVIQDTGIGMTPEQVEKLFMPFSQADSSTTRKYGGTGLGLAISQRFCNLMGGEIAVTSEFGSGSRFAFWLPENPSKPRASSAAASTAVRDRNGEPQVDVLFINNERANREQLGEQFTKEGWTVHFAGYGEDGLSAARKWRPKAICLDILIPSMDGWSILSALKGDAELRDIPVIILSFTEDTNLGFALGASEYLTKPVSREQLVEVMDKYIDNRNAHTVLVIEDDATTSEMMTKLLEKESFAVDQARNGKEALERLKLQVPNLILLDLMMPEMDGFQLVAEMRKNSAWSDIPIVVVSAKSLTSEERTRLNGYVKGILQKGTFNHKWLLAEIRRLIGG